jgi:Conserved hypothetical protein 2217 (DUF2460)
MAGTFPILSSGSAYKYPLNRKSGWLTRVNQFVDFTEQRWVTRQPLVAFVLQYKNISRADLATLKSFFDAQLGGYDNTWTMDFDGYVFNDMVFDQDDFRPVEEDEPNRFSITFKVKQTRISGWFSLPLESTSSIPTYPFIGPDGTPTSGPAVITQRPWTGGESWYTNKVSLETGAYYSYAWIQEPLMRWELNYPAITEADAAVLEKFFHQCHGRMYDFNFHDPELFLLARESPHSWASPDPGYSPVPNCRFDMDDIEIQYVQPGQWATKIYVAQFAPSLNPNSTRNTQGLPT